MNGRDKRNAVESGRFTGRGVVSGMGTQTATDVQIGVDNAGPS